ncbi:MAG: DUF4430 domain-containing protein, partial [Firmicutes bacterium]|nr:DUF4430 domain-containing protein [Bacillota bacterium]
MRRILALCLSLILTLSWLPAIPNLAQAAPQAGDIGFFWDSPGSSYGIFATTRALDALATLQEVYESDPDLVQPVELGQSIALARDYLMTQNDAGVWTDKLAGDWAALAVAKAGGDIQPHLASLQADLRPKSFDPDIENPVPTTDLARSLLVAASVYAESPDLAAFADKEGKTLWQALQERTVTETVYLDDHDVELMRFGLFTEGDTLNATTYAIIALDEVDKLDIDDEDRQKVVDWLLAARIGQGWGWQPVWAWDEDLNYGPPTPDPDSSASAIRALASLAPEDEEVREAIAGAFQYLQSLQGTDGSITSWGSPSAASTAEVIIALLTSGEDPSTFQRNGKSLVDGLLGLQQTEPYEPPQDPSTPATVTVSVEVRGQGKSFFSGTVSLAADKATPLEALKKTDLDYSKRGSYVSKIEDLEEQGSAGWKYAVNGEVPSAPADGYLLSDGDELVWFYASSYLDSGG